MGLFDERIAYKPFEYPYYYTEGWLKQAQAFWLHTEISMQSDIKDWKEKLNDKEKNLVGNILLGFAQTECAVSDYWTQKVVSWFPKHEIKQMAMMFGSQETVHAVAYSYLNETLGLEDYEAFLHEPATSARFDNLVAYDGNDPVGIAKSLAALCAPPTTTIRVAIRDSSCYERPLPLSHPPLQVRVRARRPASAAAATTTTAEQKCVVRYRTSAVGRPGRSRSDD